MSRKEPARIVRIDGDVDVSTLDGVEEMMQRATACGGEVIVDLRDCRYFGACGFRMLVRFKQELASRLIVLVAKDSLIAREFDSVGLANSLNIKEAVRSVVSGRRHPVHRR